MAEVEQGTPVSQDPTQQAPAPAATPEQSPQFASSGPWAEDIRASFQDPEEQARVDAFLRAKVQPHVTQVEQDAAAARQLYDAFAEDPYAAYEAIGQQLFSEQQAPGSPQTAPAPAAPTPQQFTDAQGNPVTLVGYDQNGQPLYAQTVTTAPPQQGSQQWQFDPVTGKPLSQAPVDPRIDEMYGEWAQDRDERLYDQAKQEFLSDPANSDINPKLFDQFVAGAETWDEAAAAYRSYAAAWAAMNAAPQPQETAPPQLGNQGGDGSSTTTVQERKSLNETIDDIFSESAAQAPPM